MKVNIISFTEKGDILNNKISNLFDDVNSVKRGELDVPLKDWVAGCQSSIIFVGAMGIAVRSIAPIVNNKEYDPAVIVCDELGRYVIPVLSGHIGGANDLSLFIAEKIGAKAVITTATDINGVWAVDKWAKSKGFKIENVENVKYISSALLHNEKVGIYSELNIKGNLPKNVENTLDCQKGIVIGDKNYKPYQYTLNITPKTFILGVGSKKNAPKDSLINSFNNMNIDKNNVAFVATINIKSREKCILELCDYLGVELKCLTAEELNNQKGSFTSSEFVKETVGCDNVCERAAAACGGDIIIPKTKGVGVTMAVSEINYINLEE